MRLSLFSICVFLFLVVCTQATSPSIRGTRQLAARRLEDQQADEAEGQDEQQQDDYQEEQDAEEEEEADDFFDYGDEENAGGQMFETAPENWTSQQWLFMVCLFAGWGALTSCICATGWLCSCFGLGPGSKEQPASSYTPSSPTSKAERTRSDSPQEDYVAMTGTEYDQQTGAYS